jgi:hypothetical protein
VPGFISMVGYLCLDMSHLCLRINMMVSTNLIVKRGEMSG